jgi:hypothetical protein
MRKGFEHHLTFQAISSCELKRCICWRESNGKNWLKKTPYFKLAKCVSFGCLCSREFTHRIKSISMAKFTTAEVVALQQGGNEVQLHLLNIS